MVPVFFQLSILVGRKDARFDGINDKARGRQQGRHAGHDKVETQPLGIHGGDSKQGGFGQDNLGTKMSRFLHDAHPAQQHHGNVKAAQGTEHVILTNRGIVRVRDTGLGQTDQAGPGGQIRASGGRRGME